MTHLLRDLLNDPTLLQHTLKPRLTVERESQEWYPECEEYVSELIYGFCLPCLEGRSSETEGLTSVFPLLGKQGHAPVHQSTSAAREPLQGVDDVFLTAVAVACSP